MAPTHTAPTTPPSRGTIILDATALITLSGRIAPERQDGAALMKHYLDFLPLLAQQGYRIVIPEIAALSVGQVFADGLALGRIYQHPGAAGKYIHSEKVVTPFLRTAAADGQGLSIACATGPEEVDAYCARLHDACTRPLLNPLSGRKETKQENSNVNHGLRHQAVRRVLESQPKQACANAVTAMLQQYAPDGVPIVLTDNKRLCDTISGTQAEVVTTGDFIAGLVTSGLWAQYGLSGTAQDVVNDSAASSRALGVKSYLATTPSTMDDAHLEQLGKGSLAKGLAEIAAGNPITTAADTPPAGYQSPLDKFRQRYGNQGKSGNGRG